MKLRIIFMLLMTIFLGCSGGSNETQEVSSSSVSPQPRVANESVRPPKLPNI